MSETQGFQVAPQENDDMSKIRQVFDHALNSIVQATALAKQVDELARKVQDLSHEVDTIRRNNAWLDEQLTRVRGERDTAMRERDEARAEVAQTKAQNEQLTGEKVHLEQVVANLREELDRTKRQRDEAQDEALGYMAKAEDAQAKLDEIKERTKVLFGLVEPDKPVPAPEVQAPTPWDTISPPQDGDVAQPRDEQGKLQAYPQPFRANW